jgi:hypothetical protein
MGPLLIVGVSSPGKDPVCNRPYALEIDLDSIEICIRPTGHPLKLAQEVSRVIENLSRE